jgi:hypothetical protein
MKEERTFLFYIPPVLWTGGTFLDGLEHLPLSE